MFCRWVAATSFVDELRLLKRFLSTAVRVEYGGYVACGVGIDRVVTVATRLQEVYSLLEQSTRDVTAGGGVIVGYGGSGHNSSRGTPCVTPRHGTHQNYGGSGGGDAGGFQVMMMSPRHAATTASSAFDLRIPTAHNTGDSDVRGCMLVPSLYVFKSLWRSI
jgi:hypothetical protein